jgi:ATP-dependent exoDNAse (exonuclease V) alpha subunit
MTEAITFTADQFRAIEAPRNAMMRGETWFLLQGPAGTGKTTLAGDLANALLPKPTLFTAPTNAATNVLRQSMNGSAQHCMTIHSALGLRPVENGNGEIRLVRQSSNKLPGFGSLVLDEVSQVGRELRNWIDGSVPPEMPVLCLGDPYQLPPVNEPASPYWKEIPAQYRLCEIVRQAADNPINEVSQLLVRQQDALQLDIEWTTPGGRERPPYTCAGSKGVFSTTYAEMLAAFRSAAFRADAGAYRVLAYTNARVQRFNRLIREAVLGKTVSPFVVGERVINRTPLGALDHHDDLQVEVPVNSELRVLEIAEDVSVLKLGGPSYRYGRGHPVETVRIRAWRIVLGLVGDELVIECHIAPRPGIRETMLARCIERRRFLDRLRIATAFPDLRNAYATTVHSAQGMTIGNAAFVDVDDIARPRHRDDELLRLQLLYVAATRPREALVIAPTLPEPMDL